jgi:hypothetical protein
MSPKDVLIVWKSAFFVVCSGLVLISILMIAIIISTASR